MSELAPHGATCVACDDVTGVAPAAGYARGDYTVDTRPLRHSPADDPYIVRVQMPLHDGTVRVVAPHGAEWTAPVSELRRATPEQRAWFDAHVPPLFRVP